MKRTWVTVFMAIAIFAYPTDAVVDQAENEWVVYEREYPDCVKPNSLFSVVTTITTKADLELVAASDLLPQEEDLGVALARGSLTSFGQGLSAGELIANTYQVAVRDDVPLGMTFTIEGAVRAKPSDADSQIMELNSQVRVCDNVQPNQAPQASLEVLPIKDTDPLTVTFSLSAVDADGVVDAWRFCPDQQLPCQVGTGMPPSAITHAYAQPGTYTATLEVEDNERTTNASLASAVVEVGRTSMFQNQNAWRLGGVLLLIVVIGGGVYWLTRKGKK